MTNDSSHTEIAIIAGGGPAGLTMAYELARRSRKVKPLLFEASDSLGGIARTVAYRGNLIDLGGHRFFSKSRVVNDIWSEIMPRQSAPALDEILTGTPAATDADAATDPQRADDVMLQRRRVSRIYQLHRFFDYPLSLSLRTLRALGLKRTIATGLGFLAARLHPRKEVTLEDFYINRFGMPLYRQCFEDYTRKVWGKHPSELGAEWGAQRVKGLSISSLLKDMLSKKLGHKNSRSTETSLIEEFLYPKAGSGQMWELMGEQAERNGAVISRDSTVTEIFVGPDNRVQRVTVAPPSGNEVSHPCDWFISSMPLNELISAIRGIKVPDEVLRIATELPFRDFITVGLLLPELKISNGTTLNTYRNRIPDTWIYVQEKEVRLGRIQVFNNWSPYMVRDFENSVWLGLEYFCNEGDELWQMSDSDFIEMAKRELESIGLIDAASVIDATRIKVKKAYPSYFGSYRELDKVKDFLSTIPNLFCIGRNGQHRYNNMDHSMLTAIKAADCILMGNVADKSDVWNVNTEQEYHEIKDN
ncbi:MAG: NAD(P)/FAD-dependent oxidoreductase [Bacteroidales bacterium]|nr:NAD(P)/FAD-dependent oxidoreductase [Bacteroidales bacterium]